MNIDEFSSLYWSDLKNSQHFFEKWDKQKNVDELLNASVAPGVVLFDVLNGDYSIDKIKPELKDAFESLMKEKADSYDEIRQYVYDKISNGDSSVQGAINKILGQVGENQFIKEAEQLGIQARLAESGSQEAWDVAVLHENGITEHVQVKFYSDPNKVIQEIREVNEKIQLGEVTDGDQIVQSINFAVPKNIHEEVVQKVKELDLDTKIYDINMTTEEGRELVELGFGFSASASLAIENLFVELFAASLQAAALHTMVNGFLLYKGAKNFEEFYGDVIEESAISTGAIGSGMGIEALIGEISTVGGPVLMVLVLGSTITTRAILKRVANRQSCIDWLSLENSKLKQTIIQLSNK